MVVNSNAKWYVLYTAPRAEKVAYQELIDHGYEAFLPMFKTLKVWKNRQKKLVEQVLFPSYIFIYTTESELYRIKQVPKIVTFIHCGGKPSVVPSKDIDCVKIMLKLDQNVTTETEFTEGENVRILYGPLAGYEGVLIKKKGKTRFGIEVCNINQTVFIDVCNSVLEKVPQLTKA